MLISVSFIPVKENLSSFIPESPLASYSIEWNETKYLKCNTAAKANYMTTAEKEVIYILNLARMNPNLFARSVVSKYPVSPSYYYSSLLDTLESLKPLKLLTPDSLCYAGAYCHAFNSGAEGYVGHTRSKEECRKKWYYSGECCDYGHNKPLDIILSLLIDEDVPSLGHREILLSDYRKIAVSIQLHKLYRFNAVLDFHY
jgi:hypothetical protein